MRVTSLALAALVWTSATVPAAFAQDDPDPAGALPGIPSERQLQGGTGYVCTGTNELRTAQCSVSCPSRDTADCEDAEAGGAPTCQCTKG